MRIEKLSSRHDLSAFDCGNEALNDWLRHPIGVILLARLAVDAGEKGKGFGAALLKDALTRCLAAAETIGARAVLVHALDEQARGSYQRFGFGRSPADEMGLMLLMMDLRRVCGGDS